MKWLEPIRVPISEDLASFLGNPFILAEQLARRNIHTARQAESFLYPEKYQQLSAFVFSDMEKISDRILAAIQEQQLIGVWGDFDVDGQTSTALLVDGLKKLGARVSFHIPIRELESHGIQKNHLEKFLRQGIQLLITCDTGITEFEAISHAHAAGVDVIISDHHSPAQTLPDCFGIINPCLLPDDHAMRGLAGVGTAFQIIRALCEKKATQDQLAGFLDLVALGTVADLAVLTGENRFYTQIGLSELNQRTRPAIASILDAAKVSGQLISESTISYTLAPRLNAVGRLGDANPNVLFLLSQDEQFLRKTALQLEALNEKRKAMVEAVFSACLEMLARHPQWLQYPVLVLSGKDWPKGVIGIAASRLVEKYHKPAILLSSDGDIAAGSARSVEGINIIQAIRQNQELLIKFGGHPMAAGMALQTDHISALREGLSSAVLEMFPGAGAEKELQIDAYVEFSRLKPDLCAEIHQLSPFGSGNPPPVLVSRELEIESVYRFGKNEAHQKIILRNADGETISSIWWNAFRFSPPAGRFDLAYLIRSDPNDPAGSPQLEWIDYREFEPETVALTPSQSKFTIVDHRTWGDKIQNIILEYEQKGNILFWGEGDRIPADPSIKNRLELERSEVLAILFPPPDSDTLAQALKRVKPKEVLLFAAIHPEDEFHKFIQNLAGMIRYSLRSKGGRADLNQLAAVLGQTSESILLGAHWWMAHGDIVFSLTGNSLELTPAKRKASQNIERITLALQQTLSETAAFRSYYLRADAHHLIDSHF